MPITTDTTSTASVYEYTSSIARRLFPQSSQAFLSNVFIGAEAFFWGRPPDYQANDIKYHDFRHTLQVTTTYGDLIAARQLANAPSITPREFELGLAAALFHDSGYLKLRSDIEGTGAKYTWCHVLRSCALAASYLPTLGLTIDEIEVVLGAIRATGSSMIGMRLKFTRQENHPLACLVASADYLAQMAASDYPEKLGALFNEFSEADDFMHIPVERRPFKSTDGLAAGTAEFWERVVKPKLENDFKGVHRFLTAADGSNPYIDAIERNLRIIMQRSTGGAP